MKKSSHRFLTLPLETDISKKQKLEKNKECKIKNLDLKTYRSLHPTN